MTCTACGTVLPDTGSHVFEDIHGRVVSRYCRACCPRCIVSLTVAGPNGTGG